MALIDDFYALIAVSGRVIGTVIPDCVVEERHLDRLTITEHPTELGAPIADHSFRNPSDVVMRIGFSNSSAGTEGWVQQAYEDLLALQQARQPFSISTGKRLYSNMLLAELEVETDEKSENALNCVASLKEIIITSTQQVGASGIASSAANQAFPQQTSPIQNFGGIRPIPFSGFQGLPF